MANPVSGDVYVRNVSVKGLASALNKLRRLSPEIQKRGLKNAMRAGATVVRKAAIINMRASDDPNTPEKVFKNIVVQFA